MITLEEAKVFKSWLEKKSPKTFGGYQKRFFRIIDGESIIYTDKDSEKYEVKGRINIDGITNVTKKDDQKFKITMSSEDRTYHLKAKTKDLRDKWVAAIELLKKAKEAPQIQPVVEKEVQEEQEDFDERKNSAVLPINKSNIEEVDYSTKSFDASMNSSSVLNTTTNSNSSKKNEKKDKKDKKEKKEKNHNHYVKMNTKILDNKGINDLISLSNPDIKKRFYSGFFKKGSKLDIKKKKYFVCLFSSRPLRDSDYEKDDKMLDNSKLKGWLQFDTLFFFNAEKEDETEPSRSLELKDCHSITCEDKDSRYYIKLEIGDENYFYYNKFQEERDLWFEVLKNSRHTAKDIANSITKRPRNMVRLINIYSKKGKEAYLEDIEAEEKKSLGNYLKISDFDTLLFVVSELEKLIKEILDGLLLTYKETGNLYEITVDYFIDFYLKIINSFWESNYNRIDNEKIIKLSNILFDFEDLLKTFKIEDDIISKNATELVKIYIKKLYKQLLEFIQNILKSEREVKQIENSKKELITNGPNDLFSTLSNIISANKNIKIQYIHTYILNMLYEGIIQFLIGTDCITSNYNIKVEPEYLIAICNNTIEFIPLLSSFIDKYKEGSVLSEKRICEELHMKSILNALNLLRKNVILRYVIELSKPLADSFNCVYHLLDLNKIIDTTSDIYFKYNTYISNVVKKYIWEEILKLTVYYYMKLLIMTSSQGFKTAGELIKKLMEDKNLLKDQYAIIVGENLTLVNLKIFDDIITFLQIDPALIPSSCLPIRKFCGSIFDIQIVGKLLLFRNDLSQDELKEVIASCNDFLKNYRENNNSGDNESFFNTMEESTERRTSVKERMKRKKRMIQKDNIQGNAINAIEDVDDIGELETNLFNFESFLDEDNDEKEKEDEKEDKDNTENTRTESNIIRVENEKVSDVIFEGKLEKKKEGYKAYQKRYFQIKSGYIYWFNDENSKHIQNKINLKNIVKIDSHGPFTFRIIVEDPNDKQSGGKIYKLRAEDEQTKNAWTKVLADELNKLKGESRNKNNAVYKTPHKKKVIKDILQLPDIGTERTNIKLQIVQQIKTEGFFKFVEENEEKKKGENINEDKKEKKKIEEMSKSDNYDPHAALFDEGELKQYDVGLEEAQEKNEEGFFGACCESFLNLFKGKKKEQEDQSNSTQ